MQAGGLFCNYFLWHWRCVWIAITYCWVFLIPKCGSECICWLRDAGDIGRKKWFVVSVWLSQQPVLELQMLPVALVWDQHCPDAVGEVVLPPMRLCEMCLAAYESSSQQRSCTCEQCLAWSCSPCPWNGEGQLCFSVRQKWRVVRDRGAGRRPPCSVLCWFWSGSLMLLLW